MSGSQRGSITLLWMALVGVIAVVTIATAGLALAYSARAQAQVASDASALAAAVATYPPAGVGGPPESRARSVAEQNGAILVTCRCRLDPTIRPRTVTVVTRVSADIPIFGELKFNAVSRAEFDPRLWLGR